MQFVELSDNQKKVYGPLIEKFKKDTKEDWNKLWHEPRDYSQYLAGLMIPKVFPYYQSCKKKVIYMGQDTYDWIDLDSVYADEADLYMFKNNSAFPQVLEDITSKTNPYHFWNYICKLQLAIHGCTSSLDSLSESDKVVLSGIGWGNLNPLEKESTIWKYGSHFCSLFDWNTYYRLFERAKEISKAKYLIAAYHPDVIICLCWNFNENLFFDGVDAQYIVEKSDNGKIAFYEIQNSKTQVIWCRHPNNLRFCSISPNDMISQIIERID